MCFVGMYCVGGSSTAALCDSSLGLYQSESGQSVCLACPAGGVLTSVEAAYCSAAPTSA